MSQLCSSMSSPEQWCYCLCNVVVAASFEFSSHAAQPVQHACSQLWCNLPAPCSVNPMFRQFWHLSLLLAVFLVMSSCSNLWGRKFGDSVVALSLAAGVLMIPARVQLEKAWAISTHDQITHPIVAHKKGRNFAAKCRIGLVFSYLVTWGSS